MSIISNEHQSGSPFDRHEESEPAKLYTDIDGNQVTLDTLCRREPAWAANIIRTLRARVGELEQDDKELSDQLQLNAEELYRQIARAESAEARVKELEEHVEFIKTVTKRGRRIAELESQLAAATQAARNLVARIDGDGGQKQDGESVRESCDRADGVVVRLQARAKELEAENASRKEHERAAILEMAKARNEKMDAQMRGDLNAWLVHDFEEERGEGLVKKLWDKAKGQHKRITDLESQLAAAREEQPAKPNAVGALCQLVEVPMKAEDIERLWNESKHANDPFDMPEWRLQSTNGRDLLERFARACELRGIERARAYPPDEWVALDAEVAKENEDG